MDEKEIMKMELVSEEHEENMMSYCELVRFLMDVEDELSTKEQYLVSDVSKTFIRVHYGLCNTMESNNDPLYNDLNSVSDMVNGYRCTVESSLSDVIVNVTNDAIKIYVDAFLIRQKNTHVDAFLYPCEYYVQNQDLKPMSVQRKENPNIVSKNPETINIDRVWSPGEYGSPSGSPKSPNDTADNLNLHHMGNFFLANEFVLNDRCKNIKQGRRQWNTSFKIEDDDDDIFNMGPETVDAQTI